MSHLPTLGLRAAEEAGVGAGAGAIASAAAGGGTGLPPHTATLDAARHDQQHQHQEFAVDSFNIHRLIISGITVASKFFSDVFYTNSRYAKVRSFFLLSSSCSAVRT
jgi:hypothetical protein